MKKQLAIYFAMCTMAFVCVSCLNDDDTETVATYPYASLTSFSIGNLNLPTASLTEDGRDTTIIKTVVGSLYPFIIDNSALQVYNPDSLPLGCDVTKVTTSVGCEGIAYYYSEETDTYEIATTTDTLDFSSPRKLIVVSTDGTYVREYSVRLNVHKVNPDVMAWESLPVAAVATPERVIAHDDKVFVYGYGASGEAVCAYTANDATVNWTAVTTLASLNGQPFFSSMQQFKNRFYLVDDVGMLAGSQNGIDWEYSAGNGVDYSANTTAFALRTLLASSDADGKMWAVAKIEDAVSDSIVYTTDGVEFTVSQALPDDFPLYNISSAVYPLTTNPNILRYVIVGYPSQDSGAAPVVWSKLSTEEQWLRLQPAGDGKFDCPSLENLTMLPYDGKLFAFGGAGIVNETAVEAFSSFYVSKDNGLTWSKISDENVALPESLIGLSAPFAATVDDKQRVWIVTGGETPVVWRGIINRLAF